MRSSRWIALLAGAAISTACATTSPPPPNRQLAEAQAAVRVAEEVGAPNDSQAVTYLALARQQLGDANRELALRNYRSATRLLRMAQVNAELAAALGREATARAEATEVRRQLDELKARVPQ
jgi:hypothetical protein